jgi:hypothetical protein
LGIKGITLPIILSMILLVGTFGNSLATTVGNVGSGDNTMDSPIPHPDGPISPDDMGAAHFMPHTVDACLTDVADCPPLMKTVNPFPPGQTNPILNSVHEEFIVGSGGPAWTDWHEKIYPSFSGWIFTGVQIAIVPAANSCPSSGTTLPGAVMGGGQQVWIDFDPALMSDQKLCLWKEVEFQGSTSPPQLQILEWPTTNGDRNGSPVGGEFIPIDATAVLIAGVQSNAINILTGLMVIGAIAFGALYVSVKRKNN